MESLKVSEMTAATALDGTELVPIIKGGVNKRATIREIVGGPVFDLRSYGATGNGSTDDTAAVAAAVAALVTAGRGKIRVPAGDYKVTQGYTLPVPFAVEGDGSATFDGTDFVSRIKCTSPTAKLFTCTGEVGSFEKITLANTASTTPSAGCAVHAVGGGSSFGTRIDFHRVYVRGFYDNLDIQVGDGWAITGGSHIFDPVRYGCRVRNTVNGDAGDWSVSDTSFISDNFGGVAGLRLESSGGAKMVNVKFNGGFVNPISMNTGGISVTSMFHAVNCSFENYVGDGVSLVGPAWPMLFFVGCEWGQYQGNTTGRPLYISGNDYVHAIGCHFHGGPAAAAMVLNNVNGARLYGCTKSGFTNLVSQTNCTDVAYEDGSELVLGGSNISVGPWFADATAQALYLGVQRTDPYQFAMLRIAAGDLLLNRPNGQTIQFRRDNGLPDLNLLGNGDAQFSYGILPATLADSAASNGAIFFGSDHSGKLCRKAGGVVTEIG